MNEKYFEEINEKLVDTLNKVIEWIRSGQLVSEAQVKQSIIVPILRDLGWDDTNPDELIPEYPIPHSGSGRVDYVLHGDTGNPLVFIEAKKLGHANEFGEQQLFQYAFGQGVPLLILTDGNIWNFYLSMAEGVTADRRFYGMVLTTTEKTDEYARSFFDYLEKIRVRSGDARTAAEKSHIDNKTRTRAKNAIPKVWRTLLEKPDPDLRSILAIAVENECGINPELDDLNNFLEKQLSLPSDNYTPIGILPPKPRKDVDSKSKSKKIVGYILDGKAKQVGVGNRTLAEILKEFHRDNSKFMFDFAAKTRGRTRRLVAQNREDLYDQQDLADFSFDMENGWWLGTNISARNVRENVKIACEIAGVSYGSQLTLIEK